jgi:BirA family transcriptional regulator, biotin operon repressor / biotin---[acetyl-CoA-carboxylase] ligase
VGRAQSLSERRPDGAPSSFLSRLERFESVPSTQAIVRDWLADGVDEVCVAVADRQTEGQGRLSRRWEDQAGRALLLSVGFRPVMLPARASWRLPAIVSIAMIGAATSLLGPTADRLALKWPNDIVAVHRGRLLKVAGVLTEGVSSGEHMETMTVGLGVNVDWPATDFPPQLADSMWSLYEASGRRRIDRDALTQAWLARLEPLYDALRQGEFDGLRWADAQITTGAQVRVETEQEAISGTAVGVDRESGALLLRMGAGIPLRIISHGEVVRCHVSDPA